MDGASILTALVAALAVPASAYAQESGEIGEARSFAIAGSGWELQRGDHDCMAAAIFDGAGGEARLAIQQRGPEPIFQITILAEFQPVADADTAIGSISWGSQTFTSQWVELGSTTGPHEYARLTISVPGSLSADPAGRIIDIDGISPAILRFDASGASDPLAALRHCTNAMAADWQLPAALDLDVMRRAELTNATQIATSGFYRAMARGGDDFDVHYRLLIDETGSVTDCAILNEALVRHRKLVCRLLADKGEFEPALDHDGNSVPGYFVSRFAMQKKR